MIRLAIVDDHAPVRQSLREYLQSCPGLQVVAEGRNGAQAAAIAVDAAPDVLLMDLAMPGQNGVDALDAIRARAPRVGVLILSGYPEELYALEMLQRGAAGFLHKNCAPEQILLAIHTVAAGQLFVPPQLASLLMPGPEAAGPTPHTERPAVELQCCPWPGELRPSVDAAA